MRRDNPQQASSRDSPALYAEESRATPNPPTAPRLIEWALWKRLLATHGVESAAVPADTKAESRRIQHRQRHTRTRRRGCACDRQAVDFIRGSLPKRCLNLPRIIIPPPQQQDTSGKSLTKQKKRDRARDRERGVDGAPPPGRPRLRLFTCDLRWHGDLRDRELDTEAGDAEIRGRGRAGGGTSSARGGDRQELPFIILCFRRPSSGGDRAQHPSQPTAGGSAVVSQKGHRGRPVEDNSWTQQTFARPVRSVLTLTFRSVPRHFSAVARAQGSRSQARPMGAAGPLESEQSECSRDVRFDRAEEASC